MENGKKIDPRVVEALREWIGPAGADVTDEQLLANTDGSFLRARLDLSIAVSDVKTAIKTAVVDDWRRLRQFFRLDA